VKESEGFVVLELEMAVTTFERLDLLTMVGRRGTMLFGTRSTLSVSRRASSRLRSMATRLERRALWSSWVVYLA